MATGSPFAPVTFGGKSIEIGQCNNMYIFPGVGLGVLAGGAARIPDTLFLAAATALSELAPVHTDATAALYPSLRTVRQVAQHVALAVALAAQEAGVAPPAPREQLARRVAAMMWRPEYRELRHRPAHSAS